MAHPAQPVEPLVHKALQAAHVERQLYNAYISIHDEAAIARARLLDQETASGSPPRPLHGLTLAVKDNIDEAGVPCSAGCRAYQDRVPSHDAQVIARLRTAGAVVIGRTNMHELADGVTSENPWHGSVLNPWDPTRHAGGSSGGSAVAVACGSSEAALGTDTGGSVRIPASLCGVVGFKPTRGILSTQGVLPLSSTLDHLGLLARRVTTVRQVFGVLAPGRHSPQVSLLGLRLGVLEGFGQEADHAVGSCFHDFLHRAEARGAVLTTVRIPGLDQGIRLLSAIYGPEAAAFHMHRMIERPGDFSAGVKRVFERALERDPARRLLALRQVEILRRDMEQASATLDFLCSPTVPHPARPLGSDNVHTYLAFTVPFNLVGRPAISLPMGSVEGLPVGLQVVGNCLGDYRLLAVATALEQALTPGE